VLLLGAGLFLRSLNNLMGVDSGFDKENVLVIGIDPAASGYKDDARLESMMQQVEDRVSSLRGISGTSFVFYLFGGGAWRTSIQVPGRTESDLGVNHNVVGPGFFDALKMPIVLGRGLDVHDTLASRRVAVINETMASVYFNNSPIGRTFSIGDDPDTQNLEVVGVVKDAKYEHLDERQRPASFLPHAQHIGGRFLYMFVARHAGDLARVIPEIRAAIREVDPSLTLGEITTLEQLVEDSVVDKRMVAQLSTFFGAVAALLACIGIYGVISFGSARRTSEFGIRMTLGARRSHVLWIILADTLQMAILGTAIGVFLAIASGSLIQSQLFGVSSRDPVTITLAIFAIVAVALLAGYLPARRAMQIDPMVALRHE
jgi:predicted permease